MTNKSLCNKMIVSSYGITQWFLVGGAFPDLKIASKKPYRKFTTTSAKWGLQTGQLSSHYNFRGKSRGCMYTIVSNSLLGHKVPCMGKDTSHWGTFRVIQLSFPAIHKIDNIDNFVQILMKIRWINFNANWHLPWCSKSISKWLISPSYLFSNICNTKIPTLLTLCIKGKTRLCM